jgi:hypothetical protein
VIITLLIILCELLHIDTSYVLLRKSRNILSLDTFYYYQITKYNILTNNRYPEVRASVSAVDNIHLSINSRHIYHDFP